MPMGMYHYFNHAQKIFEIGRNSTLGMTMWGLGNLGPMSYRSLIAQFADQLDRQLPQTLQEAAERWNAFFWAAYSTSPQVAPVLQRVQQLRGLTNPTPQEQAELAYLLQSFSGGFCLGGNLRLERSPRAFEMLYGPDLTAPPPIQELALWATRFWGCPNLIDRLIHGIDQGMLAAILQSGRWTGMPNDLVALVMPFQLAQPFDLPIREAIDWVFTAVYITIRAMKFSHLPPICGGPVEIAVVTADRPFRWVRHKRLDAAIGLGGSADVL